MGVKIGHSVFSPRKLSPQETIHAIQQKVSEQAAFWKKAHGWAPKEAADLLSSVRLDCYASLARNLNLTILSPINSPDDLSGRLVLGWSHIGSMLECSMQLLLAVHLRDYLKDSNRVYDTRKKKKPKLLLPHLLTLEYLRVFFDKSIWDENEKNAWNDWILDVQQHRNAIHALKPRPLGRWSDLESAVSKYLEFLDELDGRLPYP